MTFKLWNIPENIYIYLSGVYSTVALTILTTSYYNECVGIFELILLILLGISSVLLMISASYLHTINEKYNNYIFAMDILKCISNSHGNTATISFTYSEDYVLNHLSIIKESYWKSPCNAKPLKNLPFDVYNIVVLYILNVLILVLTICSIIVILF